ncbi:MAG TPA: hypothetical protein VIX17_17480, partial [Pyrinomonadaceae bacterium]
MNRTDRLDSLKNLQIFYDTSSVVFVDTFKGVWLSEGGVNRRGANIEFWLVIQKTREAVTN